MNAALSVESRPMESIDGVRCCDICGYDLRATSGTRCPECGASAGADAGSRLLFTQHPTTLRRIRLGAILMAALWLSRQLTSVALSDPSRTIDKIVLAMDIAVWGVSVWLITASFSSPALNRCLRTHRILLRAVTVMIVASSLFDTFVVSDWRGPAPGFWVWCILLGAGMIPLAICSVALVLYIRVLAHRSLQVIHGRLVLAMLCVSCVAWSVSFATVPVWAGTLTADLVFGSLHQELTVKFMSLLLDTGNVVSQLATFIASISLWRFMTLNIRRAKLLHSQTIATPVQQVDQGAMSS